jgi:adenylate kinase family enzyme
LINSIKVDNHIFADAFPRTVGQAEAFESAMNFYKRSNVKIVYIEVGKEEATKRMKLRGRSDDTDEGIARRFDEYVNNVIPAMNYFEGKDGYEICKINGEQSVEDVHKEIIAKLGL